MSYDVTAISPAENRPFKTLLSTIRDNGETGSDNQIRVVKGIPVKLFLLLMTTFSHLSYFHMTLKKDKTIILSKKLRINRSSSPAIAVIETT
jgi:hypothetical protein